MNVGQLLFVVKDLLTFLEASGVLLPDGTFDKTKLDTVVEGVEFALAVKEILKKHGVIVPAKVDAVLSILPTLAVLFD